MKKMRKVFSLLLSMVLVLGMIPVQGYATDCLHEQLSYFAEGECITVRCANKACNYKETATLVLDETVSRAYTGKEIQPLKIQYSDGWQGKKDAVILYADNVKVTPEQKPTEQTQPVADEDEKQLENPEESQQDTVEQKNPTGTLTIGDVSATKTFKITKGQLTVSAVVTMSYGDDAPKCTLVYTGLAEGKKAEDVLSALPVVNTNMDPQSAYNAGDVLNYTINLENVTSEYYEVTAENGTFTVSPLEAEINWGELKITYDGENHLPNPKITNKVGEDDVSLVLDITEPVSTVGKYEISVLELAGDDKDNYVLPDNATETFSIKPKAPTTVEGAAGKITGVDAAMEYKAAEETAYITVDGTEITELEPGIYHVRYAATETADASDAVEVTVTEVVAPASEDEAVTVTLPDPQIGYTLTADKTEESVKLTFTLSNGYVQGSDFAVKINGEKLDWDGRGEFAVSEIQENIAVTVEGVYPLVAIKFNEETYLSTVSKDDITYDIYLNKTPRAEIKAPKGADIYYAITAEWTDEFINMQWNAYRTESVPIPADDGKTAVFYARVDWDGDTYYASTNGIVFDTTVPTASIAGGRYYTTQEVQITDTNLKQATLETTITGKDKQTDIFSSEDLASKRIKLKGNVEAAYTIRAEDKAGNIKTVEINMEPIANLKTNVQDLGRIENIINQGTYADSNEKTALEEIKTNKNAYLAILKIQALPKVEDIVPYNADHKAAYKAAQDLYDSLTAEQKKLVENDDLDHLNAVKEALVYKITTASDKLKWEKSSGKNFVIETNVKGIELKTLLIDDDPVTKATTNYEFDKVTGKLTIKSAFLQKSAQTVGKHYIQLVFKDGGETSGTDQFEIQKAGTNPKTGDNGILFWMTASFVSMAGLAIILSGKKKHYRV